VDAVISADQAWDTENPGGLNIRRAGAWIPPFGGRVRVGVKGGYHDGPGDKGRRVQVEHGLISYRGAKNGDDPRRGIQVNPSPLFVPADGIGRERIRPGVFERLLNGSLLQQLRYGGRMHRPAFLSEPEKESPVS
jgi:hypothetical protein